MSGVKTPSVPASEAEVIGAMRFAWHTPIEGGVVGGIPAALSAARALGCLMPDEAAALREELQAEKFLSAIKVGRIANAEMERDALAARLKVADGLLTRSEEELRLIRMKDTGAIYDTLLRLDLRAVLTPAAGDAP